MKTRREQETLPREYYVRQVGNGSITNMARLSAGAESGRGRECHPQPRLHESLLVSTTLRWCTKAKGRQLLLYQHFHVVFEESVKKAIEEMNCFSQKYPDINIESS